MKKLDDHIYENYRNNKAAFARDNNLSPQQVSAMIRKGYFYVVDGFKLVMYKRDLERNNKDNQK